MSQPMCPGCAAPVKKWCCPQCWSRLPVRVQEALRRTADFDDDGAARCREVLKHQAEDFWRGDKPRGYLWA